MRRDDTMLKCIVCLIKGLKNKAYVIFSCGDVYCRKCFRERFDNCIIHHEYNIAIEWGDED
jgi:hypothetical protein